MSSTIQTLPTADFVQRFVERCAEYADQYGGELSAADRDVAGWLELLATVDVKIIEAGRQSATDLVKHWSELAGLGIWRKSSEAALTRLGMPFEVQDRLTALRLWMVGVEWPKRFPRLAGAMNNFERVLDDLLNFFTTTSAFSHKYDKFYELWDHSLVLQHGPKRRQAEREYLQNIELFMDLWFALTAAGNHVCETVREEVDSAFRLGAAKLATVHGPDQFGRFQTTCWVYPPDIRRKANPYPGIDALRESLTRQADEA